MRKPRVILYAEELSNCPCYDLVFEPEFETSIVDMAKEVLNKIRTVAAEAVVICYCAASEPALNYFLHSGALTGRIPLFFCFKTPDPDFIRKAANQGVSHFLFCGTEADKIPTLVSNAADGQVLRDAIQLYWPGCYASSPYVRKLVDEIISAFPHRFEVRELAKRMGIKRRWLQKLCLRTFGMPPTSLIRCIWVHQAMRLMKHSNLDNIDIALQLNYTEESNLARDFRKLLGYSPNEARRRLTQKTPEELIALIL